MSNDRIFEIDVVRGMAMFAVCLSHFTSVYLYQNLARAHQQVVWIHTICAFASPAFMVISGSMLGFLYETQRQRWTETKDKLLGRGLFLVTAGHVLMMTGHVARSHSILDLLRWIYITDTIGMCVIIGCVLIGRMRVWGIMGLGAAMLSLSSVVILLWHPENPFLGLIKETFFGSLTPNFYNYNFPLFLWSGLYLFGICVGRKLGALRRQSGMREVRAALTRSCFGLLSLALVLKGVQTLFLEKGTAAHWVGSIMMKYPPSPAFLLLFGGVALLILLGVFEIARIGKIKTLLTPMAILGRTSLFVFVIQYYVYYTAIYLLKLSYSEWWPLYFIVSMMVIWIPCKIWDDKGLNRLITLKGISHTGPGRRRTGPGAPLLPHVLTGRHA